MLNYRKEDLKFFNMERLELHINHTNKKDRYKIFKVQKEYSLDEKIAFIDKMEDGIASYLINILEKWDKEKIELPQSMGKVKTISKKAWIKRNDPRKIIDTSYKIGKYSLLETSYKDMTLECPKSEYSRNYAFTGCHIAEQWFHDLCEKLYREEQVYFESHDPKSMKIEELKELRNKYDTCFNNTELNDIIWNGKRDVKIEKLDVYIHAYKKLENSIKTIEEEINRNLNYHSQ